MTGAPARGRDSIAPRRVPAPLVAASAALLVYLPSLAGGFLYDDHEVVVTNPFIRDLGALRTVLLYEPSRPLLNLTWAANYALAGLTPWPYHAVNVLIHAAGAALVASLLQWMWLSARGARDEGAALLGALIFAVTPMGAETVAYVASRSTALAALFGFACLRLAAPALRDRAWKHLLAALACLVLALATKEEAAAVPILLLLLDYYFVAGGRWADVRTRLEVHFPFVVVVAFGLLARRQLTGSWLPAPAIDPRLYALTQAAAFPLYFLRAGLPFDPAFYRHHAPASWPPGASTVLWLLVSLALLALAIARRRSWPEWSFAVFALAAGLVPSSSIVALSEMVVDHRAYLGSFGIAFALGATLWRWGGARLGLAVVALLAARTIHYEWVLGDPVRAWEHTVRRVPTSPDAVCALGEAYAARGDARAEGAFRSAIALDPGNYRYWANLATFYADRDRVADAAAAMREAADRAPGNAVVRDYLGQALVALGRGEEAIREFEAAIAAEPDFAESYINLAASIAASDPARARQLLDAASRLPIDPAQAERIVALQQQLAGR